MKGLKTLRTQKGLSRKRLADIINLNPQTIYLYESDKRFPRKETLQKLCEFFKCTIDELL